MTLVQTIYFYNLKEGKSLIQDAEIDSDAKTRNQSKTIKELTKEPAEEETKPKRKVAIKKLNTMQVAAKVCLKKNQFLLILKKIILFKGS